MTYITEGKAKLSLSLPTKISRKLPVFYNPIMERNRSSSIELLQILGKKKRIGLPLAGSGIRGIRMLLELDDNIDEIHFNDSSHNAIISIKENLALNSITTKKVFLHNKDASEFLLESTGFDYIDIDPFGSPNPFIDASLRRLSREGILAITATDTSALCGTHPEACKRKYWAVPKRGPNMHELGIRILIRKVQLIGAQYDRALTPLLSFAKDHYHRVYFQSKKGKKEVSQILKCHDFFQNAGPLWTGPLGDSVILKKLKLINPWYSLLYEETLVPTVGFFALPTICKEEKFSPIPKKEKIIRAIQEKGGKASPTHFDSQGIRTDLSREEFLKIMKQT